MNLHHTSEFIKQHVSIIKIILIIILLGGGIFLRIYKINLGLPYNFIADEADIYNTVIKISLNYKFMKNLQDFAPPSYVYGMFPTYFLLICTMTLNKITSIFHFHINFDFYHVYLRTITAIFSLFIPFFTYQIHKKIFNKKQNSILVFLLTILNWKLISYSRYLNQDIYLTTLFVSSTYFFISYINEKKSNRSTFYLILSSMLFGFAVGTKITALISLPIILFCLLYKKKYKDTILFLFGIVLFFSISNPFSIINFQSFLSRIISMKTREAGVVFSSVNQNPLKYIKAFSDILSPPTLIISLFGIIFIFKDLIDKRQQKEMTDTSLTHIFLIGNLFIYFLFFSLNPRLVQRWVLPIIPIFFVYVPFGLNEISKIIKNKKITALLRCALAIVTIAFNLITSILIIKQINIGDTRVSAYLWVREYLKDKDRSNYKILVYTNKGNDPFSSIKNSDVELFKVYESANAAEYKPKNLAEYDIVITYSDMKRNYNNDYVIKNYPDYNYSWLSFENEINNPNSFAIIKKFETVNPDLLGISNIYIYEKVKK